MFKTVWIEFKPAFIKPVKIYGHKEFKKQVEELWKLYSSVANYLKNNV